jgi:hypothetical protein
MSPTPVETVNGTPVADGPRFDPLALAEAEAIRARTETETEAALAKATAEAEAIKIKAAEEAERQRIINERAAMKLEREKAEHAAKIAEANRRREEAERQAAAVRAKAEAEAKTQAAVDAERAQADAKWRSYALSFYIVCAIVALPVQLAAFWNPDAWWLLAAPLMLEGGAWVVLKGAAAAVASRRPHWHYRAIAWVLAFIAAGINLKHGLDAFDTATALGTAFASLAGPGVWDLYENGQIRKRDGIPSRRERRAAEKETQRAAEEKAAEQARAKAEKEAREKAEAERVKKLAEARAKHYPKVWEHAIRLAAALGETTVTEAVWKRAHRDIEGADPAESADILRSRNIAERRVAAARSEAPGNTPSKVTNAQRASQMPPTRKQRVYTPPTRPGRRTKGDTAPFVPAARKQASITAKQAADTATD